VQVCTAFLKGGFNRPTLRVALHDLLGVHGEIGRKEILVPMSPRTIVDVHPADGDEGFPSPLPVPRPSDDLDETGGAPIPRHSESRALGCRRDYCVRRGEFLAFDARATSHRPRTRWRRLIQGSIAIKLAD
jgi:hypothetical protein